MFAAFCCVFSEFLSCFIFVLNCRIHPSGTWYFRKVNHSLNFSGVQFNIYGGKEALMKASYTYTILHYALCVCDVKCKRLTYCHFC